MAGNKNNSNLSAVQNHHGSWGTTAQLLEACIQVWPLPGCSLVELFTGSGGGRDRTDLVQFDLKEVSGGRKRICSKSDCSLHNLVLFSAFSLNFLMKS